MIRGLQTEVFVDQRDGLGEAGVVNCDELNAIPKEWLVRRVGRLSQTKIDALDDALRFALQLR